MVFISAILSSLPLALSLLYTAARASQQIKARDRAHSVPCRGLPVLDSRTECGLFDVPVDWAYPDGEHGQIRYIKYPAATNVTREGTIFLRPGFPFDQTFLASNFEETWFMNMAAHLHSSSYGTYDLVFFDVRGRGDLDSTFPGAFNCFNSLTKKRAFYLETSAELGIESVWGEGMEFLREQTHEDAQNWLLLQTKMVKHCLAKQDTTKLKYASTAAAVRDLLALADYFDGPGSKVNYWGIEYGALIGTYLLHMFPERAGRVVLQAPPDPFEYTHSDAFEVWLRAVRYAHQTVRSFADDSGRTGRDQTPLCTAEKINTLLGTLALARSKFVGWQNSLDADTNSPVLASVIDPAILEGVYPNMNSGLAVVHLAQLMRGGTDELGLGTMPLVCGDQAVTYSPEAAEQRSVEMAGELKDALHAAPLFATSIFPPLSSLCHIWPIRAAETLPDLRAVPPISFSHPPLVLQYAQEPFYRLVENLSAVLHGIQNVSTVLQRVCYGSEDTATPQARPVVKPNMALSSSITSSWLKASSAASLLTAGPEHIVCVVVGLACCAAVAMRVLNKRRPHGGSVRLEGQ